MGSLLGYNKRPKVRDIDGNIIGQGDMAFNFAKKNPEGGIDFRNLPPEIFTLSKRHFFPSSFATIRIIGANFNVATTVLVNGHEVTDNIYFNPAVLVIGLQCSAIVGKPLITVNNGIEKVFEGFISVSPGALVDLNLADFTISTGDFVLQENDLIGNSPGTQINFSHNLVFAPGVDFDVYFYMRVQDLTTSHLRYGDYAKFGIRNATHYLGVHAYMNSGKLANNVGYGELGAIHIQGGNKSGEVLSNFKRKNGVLEYYRDGDYGYTSPNSFNTEDCYLFGSHLGQTMPEDLEIFIS